MGMLGKKLNKKGSVQDLIFIVVASVFFGIVLLMGFKIATEYNTHIQADADIPTEAKTASTRLTNFYPNAMDNIFLFLLIGLTIVAIVLAALVRIHPIFIALFFIAWVFTIFIAGVLSNVYQEMASNALLATQANQLNSVSTIIGWLPFIIGIIGVILMVIMYKTWRVETF